MCQIANFQHLYKEIHATELKAWYDQNKTMVVLDARSKEYFDGTLLPNAIWLPYNAAEKDIEKAIPSRNALVVVYCWNAECRASKFLAARLIEKGYTNIYKYPGGLQDWSRQGF